MADYAIATAPTLDVMKVLSDIQPVEHGKDTEKGNQSFAEIVSNQEKPAEGPVTAKKGTSLSAETKELDEPHSIEIIVPETLDVGLIESEVPTQPVLKILSKELPPEDLSLYADGEEILKMSDFVKGLQENKEKVLTPETQARVTFTPGDQAAPKVEQAPQFTEIIQNMPSKEEVVRSVIIKTDTTSHEDNLILNNEPQASTTMTKPILETATQPVSQNPVATELDRHSAKTEFVVVKEQETDLVNFDKAMSQPMQMESQNVKEAPAPVTSHNLQAKLPQISQEVAIQMKQGIDQHMDKVTVQLNPPSLGRIEIELQFAKDGRVNAILFADKVETYDLLQRNPQMLKEALTGAGVNPETTDLSFNYRGEGQGDEGKSRPGKNQSVLTTSQDTPETVIYRQSPSVNPDKKVDIHA